MCSTKPQRCPAQRTETEPGRFVVRLFVDALFWFFGSLPPSITVRLGCGLGWFLQRIVKYRRTAILQHLKIAFPDIADRELETLLRRIYRHYGLLLLEFLALPRVPAAKLKSLVSLEGLENLEKAQAQGSGCLILSAHTGNWEYGLARAGEENLNVNVIVKEIKGRSADYAASRLRSSHRVRTIPRRNSIRLILGALKQSELVVFVLDQNMTQDEGVFVDFFGRPAATMSGLAIIAARSGVPVVPVRAYRDEDMIHHHVCFMPPMQWEEVSADSQENIRHNTQRYTSALETMIREHPEQWIWIHRRWRTQPSPGEVTEAELIGTI